MEQEQLQNLRHSLAHLMASAVLKLYPNAKRTIGPAVENGFYYDFDFGEDVISEKELPKIEKEMRKLLPTFTSFDKQMYSKEQALEFYKDNPYKQELIEEFTKETNELSFYKSGEYSDLCKGGHADTLVGYDPQAFKLWKLAGTTWKGKEDGAKLTRIYGLAFETAEELEKYVIMLAESEKRDHKKLGPALDLFHFSELVGPGLPLFTPRGTIIREELANFVQSLQVPRGFQRVAIPHITKADLYMTSGHWDKYKDDLFKVYAREGQEFALKPMNCPHHTQIYASTPKSYRDLPIRFSEVTSVYRDEQSGEMSGLTRVRMITQDDAHIFCRPDQIESEALLCWEIIDEFYKPFGMPVKVRFSRHDPKNFEKYLGTKDVWEKAEAQLLAIIKKKGVEYSDGLGEAAHYGPKIDFIAQDSLGRHWQLATIQLDFNQPERFDLTFNSEEGKKERVVMIHRAVSGSLERFMGVLIEHYAGNFPLWLSPMQVAVLPISDKQAEYAFNVLTEIKKSLPNLRIELDDRSESIGKKIREATVKKIPYQIIVGQKEVDSSMIALRARSGEDLGQLSIENLIEKISSEIKNKA